MGEPDNSALDNADGGGVDPKKGSATSAMSQLATRFISRATPQAAGAPAAKAAAARPAVEKPVENASGDLDPALWGLSGPASPRQNAPAESPSFVPASQNHHQNAPAEVMDDFDQLIASERAAMAAPQGQPAFDDYDVRFETHAQAAQAAQPEEFEPAETVAPYAPRPGRKIGGHGGDIKQGVRFISTVLGGALVCIAALLIWNGVTGGEGDSGPVVVAADTEPYKVQPQDPGGRLVPNQNKAVYQRATGNDNQPATEQEMLLSAAEEPIDINAQDEQEALPGVSLGRDVILSEDENEALSERFGNLEGSPPPTTLAPRRVRTVEVRPDGTLVPSEVVDAAQPAVPVMPVAPEAAAPAAVAPEPVDPIQAAIAEAGLATSPVSPATPLVAEQPIAPPAAEAAAEAALTETTPPAVQLPQQVSVIPSPARRSAAPAVVAAVPSTATPSPSQPPAPVSASNANFYVQLSSHPTEAQARTALRDVSLRYANILAGTTLSIHTAELDNRGTFYRVRVGTATNRDADAICTRLKSAGADCIVSR
ncbi:SPOR domain-containing protein [Aureimonas fodinaquatilis]|uniref:SPOR domain-containing protein n=1 Tax=Aureimonas fodinaquatilis TaxID=2565783 RepID=A0A5B0DXT5_9HYPH|nr:SPOR domain-containing protein [Aureimonas fodinaquatilis]KAA0970695.1 SPOR domain-containing protein [Aureimonas fodinaquatilis]